jgi:triosephosphate isomerase
MKKFIINYKAYQESIDSGVRIAEAAAEIARETGVDVIIAPPFTLVREISKVVRTITQGVDDIEPGAFTAHVSWYEAKKGGAVGTLLNHSEERYADANNNLTYEALGRVVGLCKQNGLETYVCVQNVYEAQKVLEFEPTAIAYEPPELIGGDVSVSTAKPEVVKGFCDLVWHSSGTLPLIGAGIKTGSDVENSVALGSAGILVASGIVKSADPETAMRELVKPLSENDAVQT